MFLFWDRVRERYRESDKVFNVGNFMWIEGLGKGYSYYFGWRGLWRYGEDIELCVEMWFIRGICSVVKILIIKL